jgi:hypothetical protein
LEQNLLEGTSNKSNPAITPMVAKRDVNGVNHYSALMQKFLQYTQVPQTKAWANFQAQKLTTITTPKNKNNFTNLVETRKKEIEN